MFTIRNIMMRGTANISESINIGTRGIVNKSVHLLPRRRPSSIRQIHSTTTIPQNLHSNINHNHTNTFYSRTEYLFQHYNVKRQRMEIAWLTNPLSYPLVLIITTAVGLVLGKSLVSIIRKDVQVIYNLKRQKTILQIRI